MDVGPAISPAAPGVPTVMLTEEVPVHPPTAVALTVYTALDSNPLNTGLAMVVLLR